MKIAKVLLIVSSLLLLSGCAEQIDCDSLRETFDDAIQRSTLPIPSNNHSLCYGLNMDSDFTSLTPLLGVGTLTAYNETTGEWTLTGKDESFTMRFPQAGTPEIGAMYKVDMMNICRYLFTMLDSRYPSPVQETLLSPEPVSCR